MTVNNDISASPRYRRREAMLVFMNTLSDYGTAAYYGVETFSAGILSYDLTWATRTRHPC